MGSQGWAGRRVGTGRQMVQAGRQAGRQPGRQAGSQAARQPGRKVGEHSLSIKTIHSSEVHLAAPAGGVQLLPPHTPQAPGQLLHRLPLALSKRARSAALKCRNLDCRWLKARATAWYSSDRRALSAAARASAAACRFLRRASTSHWRVILRFCCTRASLDSRSRSTAGGDVAQHGRGMGTARAQHARSGSLRLHSAAGLEQSSSCPA